MKNNRLNSLIQRVAAKPGIPENLTRDIVHLAHRQLKAAGRVHNPQHRDVVWAVSRAQSEWSRRFLTALDARGTVSGDLALHSAA